MPLERWYRSQLEPNTEMHNCISPHRHREKVAKILENRNAYTKMKEDEVIRGLP